MIKLVPRGASFAKQDDRYMIDPQMQSCMAKAASSAGAGLLVCHLLGTCFAFDYFYVIIKLSLHILCICPYICNVLAGVMLIVWLSFLFISLFFREIII